ncbi:hypothetical protein DNTS_025805 [Danionella cerebrum]|uniref:Ig-like domain-containing protein n=1 Tax=Danionella cerebrum TaxID=2873325 RepID=A0A553Q9S7_9TELE|nr:hypothetical protein DNTS_025805 [Danionella translucida]
MGRYGTGWEGVTSLLLQLQRAEAIKHNCCSSGNLSRNAMHKNWRRACPVTSMDVLVPSQINALNGTNVKIPCTFTSCYKLDPSKFIMNWTYQETTNSTEDMFMVYKNPYKMLPVKSNRFGERVMFSGNLDKNDLSITILDVKLMDEGIYNCYVRNPPDRIAGHGIIQFVVLTELPPPRDSTIAVAIGASVGGMLALLILSMVVVKCIRRHKNQDLISDEQKMEEEAKAEGEGGTEEATKNLSLLPEDV